jgi:hypothetical protein
MTNGGRDLTPAGIRQRRLPAALLLRIGRPVPRDAVWG